MDRIFAMWQALNPDSYLVPTTNTYGPYYELPGSFVDSRNSSLAPFHSDNGTSLYTSDDVRDTLIFGYTYPELIDWNTTAAELASSVRTKINLLYNPNAADKKNSQTATGKPLVKAVDTNRAFDNITIHDAKKLGMNNLDMQWNIDIRVQRYTYNTSFSIDFFMGTPEPNPTLRPTASNLIGSHAQFIAYNISMMFPTGPPQGLVQGHVSLSHTLVVRLDRGLLQDLSPQHVVPLLAKQLQWNRRSPDGSHVDVKALKGLSIAVSSRTVKPAISVSEFPTYRELHWWPRATRGNTGGKQVYGL